MAGGWRPGGGDSLADRLSRTQRLADPPACGLPPLVTTGRHCWLLGDDGARLPGLLLEWRQAAGGWQGRIAYAGPGGDSAVLHQEWLPAERLRRADSDV